MLIHVKDHTVLTGSPHYFPVILRIGPDEATQETTPTKYELDGQRVFEALLALPGGTLDHVMSNVLEYEIKNYLKRNEQYGQDRAAEFQKVADVYRDRQRVPDKGSLEENLVKSQKSKVHEGV